MIYTFDVEDLRKQLENLPQAGRLAFGILAFERALPGYYKFLSQSNLRDRDRLRELGSVLWRYLEIHDNSIVVPVSDWDGAIESEDFDSIYTTSAIDAVSIADELRNCLINYEVGHLVNIASLRIDTVDIYIQNAAQTVLDSINLNESILNHALMQKELEHQYLDLQILAKITSSDNFWSTALRRWVDGRYATLTLAL